MLVLVEDRGYTTPCWVWQRSIHQEGYGLVAVKGRTQLAHRVVYERAKGAIPKRLQLDHLCRVRACVNPGHLEPVTGVVNTRRGASPVLTIHQVREIRRLLATGETQRSIAQRFGTNQSHVSQIKRDVIWKDVA